MLLARYVFGFGSIWLTETVIYANATLFMLASAWTLRVGGHVRVDVFYAHASARTKASIDLIGALLLLLPFALGADLAVAALRRALLGHPRALAGSRAACRWCSCSRRSSRCSPLLMALQGVAQAIRAAAALARPR